MGYFESIFHNSVTGAAGCYTISMAHISYIGFGVRVSYIGFWVRVHCVTPCDTM